MRVSRSSFCEARDKLSWEAFPYLLDRTLVSSELWLGHRARAIDGSSIQLPRSAQILEEFPLRISAFGQPHYPLLSLVVAVDIFSCQPTHTLIGNKHLSERDSLKALMNGFQKGDVSILDRNFNGKDLWRHFDGLEQHYVGRLRTNGGGVVYFNRRLKDQIIKPEPGLKIRIIRGPQLKNGDYIFVVTNLLDPRKYTRSQVLGLYKMRQAVEEVFLHLKQNLNAKNIRSRKVNGVLQEIYAALTMTSIIAGLRYVYRKAKKRWRVSFKALAWRLETAFELLLKPVSQRLFRSTFAGIGQFGHRPQPGRSYPRFSRQPENKWIKEKRRKS